MVDPAVGGAHELSAPAVRLPGQDQLPAPVPERPWEALCADLSHFRPCRYLGHLPQLSVPWIGDAYAGQPHQIALAVPAPITSRNKTDVNTITSQHSLNTK